MYTSRSFALSVNSPISTPPDDSACANIVGADSRKAILLEGGLNCNGIFKVWGYSGSGWYLLHTVTLAGVTETQVAIPDLEMMNPFAKVYVTCSAGSGPTHWRIQIGSMSGGF